MTDREDPPPASRATVPAPRSAPEARPAPGTEEAEDAESAGIAGDAESAQPMATRRAALLGVGAAVVGAGLLAACDPSGTASDEDGGGQLSTPTKKVKVAEVPVGGGVIYPEQVIVVTQPTAGQFKAFSALCMHLGCVVNQIEKGKIVCPCHGSSYNIADGSVYQGPSTVALTQRRLTVSGDTITIF
jgi:nitrite reductase/ring-hydroxylating ferredoxin subunit